MIRGSSKPKTLIDKTQSEMKGRSLEELDELFENRVSVRNFKKYHTKIQSEALHDVQNNKGAFLDQAPAHIDAEKQPTVENVETAERV